MANLFKSCFRCGGLLLAVFLLAGCLKDERTSSAAEPPSPPVAIGKTELARFNGRVRSVSDGDSLRIVDADGRNRRIRLAFVDAPELDQAHGQASAAALRRKVQRQPVTVTVLERDQYGREVAAVTLAGEDIGYWLLQQGLAWHYTSIARHRQTAAAYPLYAQAQAQAKKQRQGLWAKADAQAPWRFRQRQRAPVAAGY